MMADEPARNRRAMWLTAAGCAVLLLIFGCGPLLATWLWWR
jgi:hypothetical protein